jgi:hypothetical protein
MNIKKNSIVLLIGSLLMSLIGFFMDTDPRESSLLISIFEILMLTIILFTILSVVYFPIRLLLNALKK